MSTAADATFEAITAADLRTMDDELRNGLPFGVVGIDAGGLTRIYNTTESKLAGLGPDRVLGLDFFNAVAQCMNNYMVAQRLIDEPELDAIVPFVLTLRMRPTPVRLRLLASRAEPLRFVLIER